MVNGVDGLTGLSVMLLVGEVTRGELGYVTTQHQEMMANSA